MTDHTTTPGNLPISDETIYQETAKVAAIFWEWRHKTMNRFFAGIGGVIAATVWLYEQGHVVRRWHAIPLVIGAAYSFICYLLDTRHTTIFVECYDIASKIELKSRNDGAIFKFIKDLHKKPGSLTQILHIIYIGCAGLFFMLSILALVIGTRL